MKTIRDDIYNLFQEKNILLTRNRGQHYLKSDKVLNKLKKEAININSNTIIEIGSGAAVLTLKLAETKKNIISYEMDNGVFDCIRHLNEEFNNLTILNKDFLKSFDPDDNNNYSIVANIPYNITSKIIKKIFTQKNLPEKAILMVQKEFAKKICDSQSKTAQTVFLRICTESKILFHVSKNDFFPKPKVDSTVISIKPKETKTNLQNFYTFLQNIFSSKNKNLSNWLKKYSEKNTELKILFEKDLLRKKITQITDPEFIKIFNLISSI